MLRHARRPCCTGLHPNIRQSRPRNHAATSTTRSSATPFCKTAATSCQSKPFAAVASRIRKTSRSHSALGIVSMEHRAGLASAAGLLCVGKGVAWQHYGVLESRSGARRTMFGGGGEGGWFRQWLMGGSEKSRKMKDTMDEETQKSIRQGDNKTKKSMETVKVGLPLSLREHRGFRRIILAFNVAISNGTEITRMTLYNVI